MTSHIFMSVLDTSEMCFIDAALLLICEVHMVCRRLWQHSACIISHRRTHMKFVVIWCISHSYFVWRIHFTFYEIPSAMHSLYRSALIKYIINLLYFFAPLIFAVDIQQLVWRGGGNTCFHRGGGERKSTKAVSQYLQSCLPRQHLWASLACSDFKIRWSG